MGINKDGLSTAKSASSTKHITRSMQKPAKFHKDDNSSISEQMSHVPKIWKTTLSSTNEEDQVQMTVEKDEDVNRNETEVAWQSESHVMHDTVHAQNQPLTIEGRINEWKKHRRLLSLASKDGAVNVDNLSEPLSSTEVVKNRGSEVNADPNMNSRYERTMKNYIISRNSDDNERAEYYEDQSSPHASDDSSTEPKLPLSPDPVYDEEMNNYNIELDSKGAQDADIDPIPIPGPPVLFLPSPDVAETDDYQGNLAKSPTSSVYKLAAETSDKVVEKLPSTRANGIQDSPVLGVPILSSKVSMVEATLFSQAMKFGSTRSEYGDLKSYMNLEEENKPCCCSRKERVQRDSIVYYQESQLLRRTVSATMLPTKEHI